MGESLGACVACLTAPAVERQDQTGDEWRNDLCSPCFDAAVQKALDERWGEHTDECIILACEGECTAPCEYCHGFPCGCDYLYETAKEMGRWG